MRNIHGIIRTDEGGQGTLQLIVPLLLVLFALAGIATLLPKLSTVETIGLTAGIVIFIISFASTEFALYILIFSMLLSPEFIVGATKGAALSRGVTFRLDDFILAIIGFSWLAKMSINKELGLFLRTPLNKPIAYYILVCLLSTLFGSLFGKVYLLTGFFFVLKYFEYMIVYFMVANHLKDERQIRNFLWAILITCAIVSVIGIYQIPSGGRVSAPFEGASGEPNTLGGYLVLMISVVTGLLLTTKSFRDRLIFSGLIILFIIPFIYTQSRSSYIAIMPAMLTFIFLSEKRNVLVVAFILIVLSIPFLAPRAAKERISYTFVQGRERADVVEIGGMKLDTSTSARIVSWREASINWLQHPIMGFGVTGYRFVDAQYVRVLTETGILGIITFAVLLITIFRRVKSIFKESENPFLKGLSMGFLASFVGLLFHALGANTFIIVRIMEPFWFIAAMVFMIPNINSPGPPVHTV